MDYNHKKKINDKIKKVTNQDILYEIFNIVKDELEKNKQNYTQNNNGIYFDLNKIPDNLILEIERVLNDNLINTDTETN